MSDVWMLVKRGLYYRPNYCGYTGIRDHAGRYTQEEAQASAINGVTMIEADKAPEFSAACFDDVAREHLRAEIARLTAANEQLHEIAQNDAAIAEKQREQIASLTAELADVRREWTLLGVVADTLTAERDALQAALRDAAYALFQIKRMQPEAVRQFASDAHTKACAVIDGEVREQRTTAADRASAMEPGEMSAGLAKRAREPWAD